MHHITALARAVIFDNLDAALLHAAKAMPVLPYLGSSIMLAEYTFWHALALAKQRSEHTTLDTDAHATLDDLRARLAAWAALAPANFAHKLELLDALTAITQARPLDAMESFDRAINDAAREGFLQDEAIANELAASFYTSLGRTRIAHVYLDAAFTCYLRWGARAKAAQLANLHGRWGVT